MDTRLIYDERSGKHISDIPVGALNPFVTEAGAATLTNKTLTAPIISAPALTSPVITGKPTTYSTVTTYTPGIVFQRPFSSDDAAIAGLDDAAMAARQPPADPSAPAQAPQLGRRMFQKGLETITWKADDPAGDRLSYSLLYRREGEDTWRTLKSGLIDSIFVWDTTTVPDGRYVIKVVASDAPTNTAERALTGEREGDAFEVDNTPPTIVTEVTRQGDATRLVVRVHDAESGVQKVEYAIGGGGWQLVYPVDGVADSRDERYEITLPAGTDASRVVIRATDVLQNVIARPASGG